MLHRVDIHFIFDRVDAGTAQIGSLLDKERFIDVHRFFIHPYHHRFEVAVNDRQVVRMHQHFTTGYVDFVFQCQCNRLRRESVIQFAVVCHDTLHLGSLSGRQCHHCISLADNTRCHFTAETTEVKVRAQHILHRETEIREVMIIIDMNRFEEVQQRDSFIPWCAFGLIHNVVTVQSRKRNTVHIRNTQRFYEFLVFRYNLVEPFLGEVHQVHLIDRQHHVLDAQQRYQKSMTTGLGNHTRTGVYQDNCQIGRRATGNHITCILFVSRSIRNDKLTAIGREVAVSHINRNPLLTLRFQSIEQQSIVYMFACITYTLTVTFQCIQLIFVQFLTVKQQTSDQSRFSVIHRTGSQQSQQVFLFVFIQKGLYIQLIIHFQLLVF